MKRVGAEPPAWSPPASSEPAARADGVGRTAPAPRPSASPPVGAQAPSLGPAPSLVAGRTASTIPPRTVSLPAGWPPSFDLGRAAAGVVDILAAQGKPDAGVAAAITFTDADLTLFEAPALPTYLVHAKTGALLMHPETGQPVRLGMGPGRDAKAEQAELAAAYPSLDLSAYRQDNREFDSVANILSAQPIPVTVDALKQSADTRRQFVVTARGSNTAVRDGLAAYLERREVPMDGVFMIYHAEEASKLGLDAQVKGQGQRKALTMAAVLHRYDPSMATVRHVRFIDDNDENLRAAMTLLPALFPRIRFEFVDVVHEGHGQYRHQTVARSSRDGGLADARGQALSAADIEAYRSADAPLPPAPPPIGFWKAEEPFGELANFAAYPITLDGQVWPTTEHYFQAQKFVGTPHADEIRQAATPALAAAMGRDKSRPLRADWEQVKEDVMRTALAAKFDQHAELRELLLSTGGALLTEASPKDAYWGTGPEGTGKNRLGELLMELRAKLGE